MYALAIQVELEAGNVTQDIVEMAALCHELLTSDAPEGDITHSVTLISQVVSSKFDMGVPGQPLDQVIECLREARKHKPDQRNARFVRAYSLTCRYFLTFVHDDYEEAASVLDEITTSSSPGDSRDKFVAEAQRMVTTLAMIRSTAHHSPEYSEEAMYRARAFLGQSSVKEPFDPALFFDLEGTAKRRVSYFCPIEGIEASSGNSPLSRPMPVVSVKDSSEFGRVYKKMELLEGLLSGIRNSDITKIDEAIKEGRTILASSYPSKWFACHPFELFGEILFEAFQRTNKIEYLDESINARRRALEHPSPQWLRFTTLSPLSLSLLDRSESFPGHCTQDLDEGLELLSRCVNDGHASLPDRFQLASLWAFVARQTQHPSVSTAYESAVSLMQDNLLFAPTLQLQHATLARSDGVSHRMPLDYASYQVELGQIDEAIETLERGRALLWSEMRHLRASIDQILGADPELGHKFAAINRDLEELTKSISDRKSTRLNSS